MVDFLTVREIGNISREIIERQIEKFELGELAKFRRNIPRKKIICKAKTGEIFGHG